VVLGGLISEETQESVQKVPFLGDLPIIGHLFKSSSSGVKKKNLMIFIKPTIIRDGITMEGIAGRKYNYFRALQIEQQERGVNLMPDSEVPVLEEWDQDAYLPDEVNEVLNRYKEGKSLETKMRETDPALRHISESKDKDKQLAEEAAVVEEAEKAEQEDDANE
jgi:general secretion pathway protein D